MARPDTYECVDPRDPDGDLLTVEFKVTSPGCAAQTYGPPENCYPAEPMEIEIHAVRNSSGADVLAALTTEQVAAIETDIIENADLADDGPDPDDWRDDQFDRELCGAL